MKKILLLLLVLAGVINCQDFHSYPSAFYTYAKYNNSFFNHANSYSLYVPISAGPKLNVLLSAENNDIRGEYLNYKQNFFTAGYSGYFFVNNLIKFNYGFIKGDPKYKYYPNTPSDFTNIYSIEGIHYFEEIILGASYYHLNQIGYKALTADVYSLRLERYLGYRALISVKGIYTALNDKRNLFGVSFRANYLLFDNLLLKAGGFIGNRAYYFDNDLLTIYNQDETQKQLAFFEFNYFVTSYAEIIGSFINTEFQTYSINYLVGGLKFFL